MNYSSAKNQRISAKLVDREILHCISSTISHLIEHHRSTSDFDYEDLLAVSTKYDYETPAQEEGWIKTEKSAVLFLKPITEDHEEDEAWADDWQELCAEKGIDPYQSEALEHWAVSNWFADKLKEQGEMVAEILDFHVWGRTCSGQAIHMDCVIGEIAEKMEILTGQKNEWSLK